MDFETSKRKKEQEVKEDKVVFEVTISKGVVRRIEYKLGSNATMVAKRFCKENSLPMALVGRLKEEITRHVEEYMDSINKP